MKGAGEEGFIHSVYELYPSELAFLLRSLIKRSPPSSYELYPTKDRAHKQTNQINLTYPTMDRAHKQKHSEPSTCERFWNARLPQIVL